jgi:hypothetical protein
MPVRAQLRVQQPAIDADLETPSVRGDQGERLDLGLEFLEQFCRQTGGAVGVVSDRTVDKLDFQ